MQSDDALQKIRRDLVEDAALFRFITDDLVKKIEQQKRKPLPITGDITDSMLRTLSSLRERNDVFAKNGNAVTEHTALDSLYREKRQLIADIHATIALAGSLVTSSHWQSPAIDQSQVDQRGALPGKILAHYNDYTRDQHVLGEVFEKRYRRQYVPVPFTIPVFTYATTSGMAALTTAALFVMGETPNESTILMGTSCYFETKQMLLSMFGKRIVPVDVTDSDAIREAVIANRPSAIFVDTIGNEPLMRVADIPSLITAMSLSRAGKTYVVADISASNMMHPLMRGARLPKGMTLIGVESQNKFLQLGFDRVTAGVVWGTGFTAMKLYDYRDHAGTIGTDATIAALPTPNRIIAHRYISRLGRNANLLAKLLRTNTKLIRKGITVVYPECDFFGGAYLMLSWKQHPFRTFDRYIRTVMSLAKKRNIALVHGTSFGFHTTRIYTVAMHTLYEKPFLRIAPGTETEAQMQDIYRLLIDAFS